MFGALGFRAHYRRRGCSYLMDVEPPGGPYFRRSLGGSRGGKLSRRWGEPPTSARLPGWATGSMTGLGSGLRSSWEKNWPEVHAVLTGSFPSFVFSGRPSDLGSVVPVFCYHLVDPEEFERDLEFLSFNGYLTIDADALLAHMLGSELAPSRSVVLTVDDGARNLFEVAFPLLKKYGAKVVAFIAPGLHPEAASAPMACRLRPCTWSELEIMHQSGHVDFQAHTFEHRYVPRWPEPMILTGSDPELVSSLRGVPLSMRDDFRRSRRTIEEKLGKRVAHLAFPKWQGTADALAVGAWCGFQAFWWGYLTGHRGNKPGQSPHRVARIDSIYLRRLPGKGRLSVGAALKKRFSAITARWAAGRGEEAGQAADTDD